MFIYSQKALMFISRKPENYYADLNHKPNMTKLSDSLH